MPFNIHYTSVEKITMQTDKELVMESLPRKVFNPVFVAGCILFISSMFLKANVDDKWAAIPLGISAFILLAGVWTLSANAKVVFDCYEHKVFLIYKHLGYLQKIYTVPLSSVERVEVKNSNRLYLIKDNGEEILISNSKFFTSNDVQEVANKANLFLKKSNQ